MVDTLLKVEQNDKLYVWQLYDTNEENLKRDIEILKQWLKKQPHLPQGIQEDSFFEHFLIGNKYRVETTKQKIDDYYTIKAIRKELFINFGKVVPSKSVMTVLPLPILTEKKERIFLIKLINKDPDEFDYVELRRTTTAFIELILKYDYCSGIRVIFDFEGFTINHLKKINPLEAYKTSQLVQDSFANIISGLEVINASPIITVLMNFFKMVLTSKLYEKINVHENIESLLKIVPKEILPKDYDGNLDTAEEILKKWDPVFEDHREFFYNIMKQVSNESLRIGPCKYSEDMFGTKGTFKKINID